MSPQYATPGVYIEELTGAGVIAGVGTSTAAFIGPTVRGPVGVPRRITSFDEFIALYGDISRTPPWPYLYEGSRPYYLPFAVEGFFTNGGLYAYILRVGTGANASAVLQNQAGEDVAVLSALAEGAVGNEISFETEPAGMQAVAQASAGVDDVDGGGTQVVVDDATDFRRGDRVTDGTDTATIDEIDGSTLVLDAALGSVAQGDTVRIADIETGVDSFRVESTVGLRPGGTALLEEPGGTPELVRLEQVNRQTGAITLADPVTADVSLAGGAPTLRAAHALVVGSADVASTVDEEDRGQEVTKVTVEDAADPSFRATDVFQPGDLVTSNGTDTGEIQRIDGNELVLDRVVAGIGTDVRIADLAPARRRARVGDAGALSPGTVVRLVGDDADNPGTAVEDYVEVESVDGAGFVTFAALPARTNTYNLDVAEDEAPLLISENVRLIVTGPQPAAGNAPEERFEDLSLHPFHPRFLLSPGVVDSELVALTAPEEPPTQTDYPGALMALGAQSLANGAPDSPSALSAAEYQDALDRLRDVDDANIVCIPDAAAHAERRTIQDALVAHCLNMGERFAILDPERGMAPSGPGSVEEMVGEVRAERGFAALYYPWLMRRDPASQPRQPRTLLVPPSGHMAGVYARTDESRGVHKPPANTDVRGVLGLEERLSDRQQGPLNLLGVNVLRIFPGSAQVTVWGARTTVDPNVTDWVYVNVRRLLLFIEESIAESLRPQIFEANDLALWQALRRKIGDFLTRVWRDGALFGATAEEAFQVRIDEALNPPSVRALGRLYVEIKVAPVRPAEFIVVRIGLWDGGSETTEQ